MIRLLATPTGPVNPTQLADEAGAVGVNWVGNDTDGWQVAAYWNTNPPTQQQFEAVVAAHVPTPEPSIAEVFADVPVTSLEEANTVLTNLQAALSAKGII